MNHHRTGYSGYEATLFVSDAGEPETDQIECVRH